MSKNEVGIMCGCALSPEKHGMWIDSERKIYYKVQIFKDQLIQQRDRLQYLEIRR